MEINNMFKIKLGKNSKLPINKWSEPKNHFKEITDTSHNIGILTGKINNLIVVDIDVKDDGIEEFEKYISEHGEPNTVIIKTPSGGYHYYFQHAHDDEESQFLIQNYLNNKSKFRGKGIDIRSNGGYIVAPPSKINGKSYKYIKQGEILQIPESLIHFLMVGSDVKLKPNPSKETPSQKEPKLKYNNYCFCIDDALILEMLSKLEAKYLNNYSDWLIVMSVLRSLDKFEIFDEWSKNTSHYNRTNNKYLWKQNSGVLDINYLVYVLNKDSNNNYKLITKYKLYEPITTHTPKNHIIMNNKYLFCQGYDKPQLTYDLFNKHDTLIIKSCTGTGKTTSIATHIENYIMNNQATKFLSITTRRTLSEQHEFTFKNIKMQNYQNLNSLYGDKHLTLCLNSLERIDNLDDEQLTDYVIYIDEISSFLELTHNKTLDNNLKNIFTTLMRFIKHARKVIVSDALINDNVFEFLKNRNLDNTLYIENTFQKYKHVKAHRIRDENVFLDLLVEHCKSGDYFMFGCDSNATITKYYNKCMSEATEEDKDKFILITADTNFKIHNASEQFRNHYVFYSPKITFGVDMTIDDKQDVFIYMKGMSIQPTGIFQQATRCRNIQTLYYYAEVDAHHENYNTISTLKESMKNHIKSYNNYMQSPHDMKELMKMSSYLDENDEPQVCENTFFNLYCYNEYVNDIFSTNKICHFENILKYNGFMMSSDEEPVRLDKEVMKEMKQLTIDNKDEYFENYMSSTSRRDEQYEYINHNIELLGLGKTNDDVLRCYKDVLTDRYLLEDHFNIIRMLKSDKYVDDKLDDCNFKGYDIKTMFNTYHKIKQVRDLERLHDIKPFDVNYKMEGEVNKMTDATYNLIKKVFKTTKAKPTTYGELKKLYISMIKHITVSDIIKAKQTTDRSKAKRNTILYTLNEDVIKFHLGLNKYMNPGCVKFHNEIVEIFKITVSIPNMPNINIDCLDVFVD